MAKLNIHSHTSEKTVQSKLVRKLRLDGWTVIRLTNVYPAGTPDVLALKQGQAKFYECKSAIGKASPVQLEIHRILREQGFTVEIINK